jgi:hypothetical protein
MEAWLQLLCELELVQSVAAQETSLHLQVPRIPSQVAH